MQVRSLSSSISRLSSSSCLIIAGIVSAWLTQSLAASLSLLTANAGCGPGTKPHNGVCVDLTNRDVLAALKWLSEPPTANVPCSKMSTSQGIAVCEDFLPATINKDTCNVVSFIGTNWCDHYGSLAFERYWSDRGCNVTLYHFHIRFKGK